MHDAVALVTTIIVVIILLAVIIWFINQQRSKGQIDERVKKRSADSILAHRALYMEGRERLPVSLSLTSSTIFYENADLEARLDLDRIDEVEYDEETTTGLSQEGSRVLRLRSHGQVFEFIITKAQAKEWMEHLPTHHLDEPGSVHAN